MSGNFGTARETIPVMKYDRSSIDQVVVGCGWFKNEYQEDISGSE
jgi:hypothetical protein